jgi:cytoskeletal protein RodZ
MPEEPSQADAMDVGAMLRDARERRGLSLDELSRRTKISVTILGAIENNRMEKLPGGIFTRGFLSAYAHEVGLDPKDTVRRYLGQFEPVTVELARPGTGDARPEHARAARGQMDREEAERRAVRVQWLLGAVVLVIGLVGYCTFAWWRAPASRTALPVPQPASVVERSSSPALSPTTDGAAPRETATAGSPEPTRAVATDRDALHVDIRPQALCWLSAPSDGTRVVYRLMQPGEQQTIEVHDEAVLRVGDPAAFAFSINGMSGHLLGRAGEAVTVHISRQNYREFLRPREGA